MVMKRGVIVTMVMLLGIACVTFVRPAAECGDIREGAESVTVRVAVAVAGGADGSAAVCVGSTDEERKSLGERLSVAVNNGDVDEVERLIAQGVLVNRENEHGKTLLHNAVNVDYSVLNCGDYANRDYVGVVHALVRAGADVNEVDCLGWSSVRSAVSLHAKMVMDSGHEQFVGYSANRFKIVELLLSRSVDFENRIGGRSLLIWTINRMDYLTSSGITAQIKDSSRLRLAYRYYVDVASLLLEAGAMIDTQDNEGETPLMLSLSKGVRSRGYYDMTQMLIIAGANLDIKDKDGCTAFDRLETLEERDMFARALAERDRIRAVKHEVVLLYLQGASPLVDLVLEYEGRYPVRAVRKAEDAK